MVGAMTTNALRAGGLFGQGDGAAPGAGHFNVAGAPIGGQGAEGVAVPGAGDFADAFPNVVGHRAVEEGAFFAGEVLGEGDVRDAGDIQVGGVGAGDAVGRAAEAGRVGGVVAGR